MSEKWGVLLYRSILGDAWGANDSFILIGDSLAYTPTNGPRFSVTISTGALTL